MMPLEDAALDRVTRGSLGGGTNPRFTGERNTAIGEWLVRGDTDTILLRDVS
ncbi:hypothetical protein ACFOD3_11090 [Falsiroseomonas tokyonensis]|uniref:Uncharacterized protein n=2 Tax=Falsiroseomonas tokyonensis TaxID=430521 RepID=A0ABV7BRW5_9PROT|nr:hypothetical protein [Falsiroseomonas tokyonensis]